MNKQSKGPEFASEDQVKVFHDVLIAAGAVGGMKGICARDLVKIMKLERPADFRAYVGRRIRALVHWAPFYGYPILADNNGHYIARTQEEGEYVAKRLERYAATHHERAAAIRDVTQKLPTASELHLQAAA